MCWSGEASLALASLGFAGTAWAAYKKESPMLWVTLAYFSSMELLQAFTYTVINQCSSPANQIATLLGYLHIAFQPFFINMISMYFIPEAVRDKIKIPVFTCCFIASIVLIIQLYPFDWAGVCHIGRPLCARQLCSVSGNWHIAWDVPTNGLGNYFFDNQIYGLRAGFIAYTLAGFLLPILYGSWRFTMYHLIMGPSFAAMTTSNVNEWPAVWCLLSIAFLLIVVKTPIRKILHVRSWVFWPKRFRIRQ